jgi:hypothetical protein
VPPQTNALRVQIRDRSRHGTAIRGCPRRWRDSRLSSEASGIVVADSAVSAAMVADPMLIPVMTSSPRNASQQRPGNPVVVRSVPSEEPRAYRSAISKWYRSRRSVPIP